MPQSYICDIIVLTWNKVEVTKNFVESLLRSTKLPVRVLFIDNASSDGTPDYLRSLKGTSNCHFEIIFNKENLGFIKGVNQGLAKTTAPFICLANNDLTFTPGWLEDILDLFKDRPDIGLLNPNSNNLGVKPKEDRSIDDFSVELKTNFSGRFIELTDCIGFCMVLRRDVLEKVGGLSEEFLPMFFEDTDFSRRVKRSGYRVGMAQASYVWHDEHTSIDQLGKEKQEIFEKSRKTFLKKWGRTLRIAWIVNSEDELKKNIQKALLMARDGNYIWFFVKDLKKDRREIFRDNSLDEYSDIKFVNYRSSVDLVWKIIIKKKSFDVFFTQDSFLKKILRVLGKNADCSLNQELIHSLKHQ